MKNIPFVPVDRFMVLLLPHVKDNRVEIKTGISGSRLVQFHFESETGVIGNIQVRPEYNDEKELFRCSFVIRKLKETQEIEIRDICLDMSADTMMQHIEEIFNLHFRKITV